MLFDFIGEPYISGNRIKAKLLRKIFATVNDKSKNGDSTNSVADQQMKLNNQTKEGKQDVNTFVFEEKNDTLANLSNTIRNESGTNGATSTTQR